MGSIISQAQGQLAGAVASPRGIPHATIIRMAAPMAGGTPPPRAAAPQGGTLPRIFRPHVPESTTPVDVQVRVCGIVHGKL